MIFTASPLRAVARETLQWTGLAGTTVILGQIVLAEDTVSVLMKQRLADMTGKEATVQTVDYAPGAASIPHLHPGSVFVYVLEGTVITQVEGDSPMTYTKGQGWYESPKQPHVVSKNASETEAARILVFLLSQEGESIFVPMKSSGRGR